MKINNKIKMLLAVVAVSAAAFGAYEYDRAYHPQFCTAQVTTNSGYTNTLPVVIKDYGLFYGIGFDAMKYITSPYSDSMMWSGKLSNVVYNGNNVKLKQGETNFMKTELNGRTVYSVKDSYQTVYIDTMMCAK